MPALTISAVDAALNTLTVTAHGQVTGNGPAAVRVGVAGAIPGGLAPVIDYWLVVTDANTVKLSTSSANALANVTIDITTTGTLPLTLEIGIPYRRARTYVPRAVNVAGAQVKSADLNSLQDVATALWDFLTGQAQSLWAALVIAVDTTLGGALTLSGVATPASYAVQQDNYAVAPTGVSMTRLVATSTAGAPPNNQITGIANGSAGRVLVLLNVGTLPIVLVHEGGTSTAANRFKLVGASTVSIAADASAILVYDAVTSRWRIAS